MGAAVLADLVVAVVPVALGVVARALGVVARALGVARPPAVQAGQVLAAGQGEMKGIADLPARMASVLNARLVPRATVSVARMGTAQQGHREMATADLRVRRETVSVAPTVTGRIVQLAQPGTGSAEVLANGQNVQAARRETGNAALMVIGPRA